MVKLPPRVILKDRRHLRLLALKRQDQRRPLEAAANGPGEDSLAVQHNKLRVAVEKEHLCHYGLKLLRKIEPYKTGLVNRRRNAQESGCESAPGSPSPWLPGEFARYEDDQKYHVGYVSRDCLPLCYLQLGYDRYRHHRNGTSPGNRNQKSYRLVLPS